MCWQDKYAWAAGEQYSQLRGVLIDPGASSTNYELIGFENGLCVMRYGGEIENPRWDGRLNTLCRVPPALGLQRYAVGDLGVDFSALAPQCIIE